MNEEYKKAFGRGDSNQIRMENVNKTWQMFWQGIITKENATDTLWRHFSRENNPELKLKIASKIQHIERGYW